MSKKKISFIAQFPPPIHGLSKAVETLYNSNLTDEFEFEKIDITDNKDFAKNLIKIISSQADLFYFTISQTRGGNFRDLIILKLLSLKRKKCIIHLHGGHYRKLLDTELNKWQKKLNYKYMKHVNGAIVLSKTLTKVFEGIIDKKKVFTVPNCVDNEFLSSEVEFQRKLARLHKKKVLNILYLSNFIESKGYRDVLKMAQFEKERVLSGSAKRFHFNFAGKFFEVKEKDFFTKYIRENKLEEFVTYHGIVESEQKRELLQKGDIFILLTRYPNEGQPISMLEAMGNGMVIVTTDHAGIPDIITDKVNGVVINKDAINISKIYDLLHDLEISSVATHNREEALSKYSEKKYLDNMRNIFINN